MEPGGQYGVKALYVLSERLLKTVESPLLVIGGQRMRGDKKCIARINAVHKIVRHAKESATNKKGQTTWGPHSLSDLPHEWAVR